jgi:hypothetical protein
MGGMAKPPRNPKLTDAERHKRFTETAKEIGASDDAKAFDHAFEKVVRRVSLNPRKPDSEGR